MDTQGSFKKVCTSIEVRFAVSDIAPTSNTDSGQVSGGNPLSGDEVLDWSDSQYDLLKFGGLELGETPLYRSVRCLSREGGQLRYSV